MSLEDLQKLLGIQFSDRKLLERALTHTSFVHEKKVAVSDSNERLEFLGDAVLNLCVAELLIHYFPEEPEGVLSKRRALLVNQKRLSALASAVDLGAFLRLGKGAEKTGGRKKDSILADAYEALIGAFYLDQGWASIEAYLKKIFSPLLTELTQLETTEDFKTQLQEFLQKRFQKSPRYSVIQETGPDHQKMFEVQIEFYGKTLGQGRGRSKREAEQAAARVAYTELSVENLEKIEAKARRMANIDLKKKSKVKAQSVK